MPPVLGQHIEIREVPKDYVIGDEARKADLFSGSSRLRRVDIDGIRRRFVQPEAEEVVDHVLQFHLGQGLAPV